MISNVWGLLGYLSPKYPNFMFWKHEFVMLFHLLMDWIFYLFLPSACLLFLWNHGWFQKIYVLLYPTFSILQNMCKVVLQKFLDEILNHLNIGKTYCGKVGKSTLFIHTSRLQTQVLWKTPFTSFEFSFQAPQDFQHHRKHNYKYWPSSEMAYWQ